MASVDADPMPGVRSLRLVRGVGVRVAARGLALLATILDVEPARLRAEIAAIRPARRRLITALLAAIGGTIAGTAVAIVYLTSSSAIAAAPTDQAVVRFETASRDSYDSIVMRPLFYRSRQPAAVPAERAALPGIGDPQVSLRGVFINGDDAKVFVVSAEHPTGVWRRRGEDVAGWRVGEIFPNRVLLESRAEQLVVPLSHSNGR